MIAPVEHVADEESANRREDKLDHPHCDELGVAAAEVEPITTQQAKPNAGM